MEISEMTMGEILHGILEKAKKIDTNTILLAKEGEFSEDEAMEIVTRDPFAVERLPLTERVAAQVIKTAPIALVNHPGLDKATYKPGFTVCDLFFMAANALIERRNDALWKHIGAPMPTIGEKAPYVNMLLGGWGIIRENYRTGMIPNIYKEYGVQLQLRILLCFMYEMYGGECFSDNRELSESERVAREFHGFAQVVEHVPELYYYMLPQYRAVWEIILLAVAVDRQNYFYVPSPGEAFRVSDNDDAMAFAQVYFKNTKGPDLENLIKEIRALYPNLKDLRDRETELY